MVLALRLAYVAHANRDKAARARAADASAIASVVANVIDDSSGTVGVATFAGRASRGFT